VLEDGIVGPIFKAPIAPGHRAWMWASGHNGDIRRAGFGYDPTRYAAMTALAKSRRREWSIAPARRDSGDLGACNRQGVAEPSFSSSPLS
jgi:hypothetical protein